MSYPHDKTQGQGQQKPGQPQDPTKRDQQRPGQPQDPMKRDQKPGQNNPKERK
jgi:hypothetical protein